jgi:hypothetical protein
MDFTQIAISVPVIVGVVEVIKRVGLSSKYAPIVSLILGVGSAMYFVGITQDATLYGLVIGLTASGLYSGGKALIK